MTSAGAIARGAVFLRRLSSSATAVTHAASPRPSLVALEVDASGRAWRSNVEVGRGDGLLAGLHPRDAPLLERTGSFGDNPATLTARPGMLIVRFQPFSAVIGGGRALLVDGNRASSKAAAGAIVAAVSERGHPSRPEGAMLTGDDEDEARDDDATAALAVSLSEEDDRARTRKNAVAADDFPLRALECVLDEATGYYHQKLRRLTLLTEYCLETITDELKSPGWGPGTGEAGFQRLLPLRRAMSELESDIREAHHAISDAMRSDERVDALLPRSAGAKRPCPRNGEGGAQGLNRHVAGGESADEEGEGEGELEPDPDRRAALVGVLQTHLWRIRAAGGQLSELSQQVEATREVWELFLDGVRNRTVRLNLQATIMTLALTVTAVPASLAGMNIPNGFEESPPVLFWGFTATLTAMSVGVWANFMGAFRSSPRSGRGMTGAKVDDLRALRFVLQRMDELDDVMRAKGALRKESGGGIGSKEELVEALKQAEKGAGLRGKEGGKLSAAAGLGSGTGVFGAGSAGGGAGLGLAAQFAALDPSALDLIFKVFDRDGDGRIDPSQEWIIRPWPLKDGDGGGDKD